MQLEFAFFDAQIQGSTKDYSSMQISTADSAGPQSLGSQLNGKGARDIERFSGVHGRVSLLCVDFDDTLTDGDTTGLLVEAAKAQVRFGRGACGVSPCPYKAPPVHTKHCSFFESLRALSRERRLIFYPRHRGTRSFTDWCSFFTCKSAHGREPIRRPLSMNGRCYRKISFASGAR